MTLPQQARPGGAQEGLSVVFQRPSVDPKLTARQNMLLAAMLHGIPASVARERSDNLLDRVMRKKFPESKYLTGKGDRTAPWWKLWDPDW
mgnify:CR=1 FL=1